MHIILLWLNFLLKLKTIRFCINSRYISSYAPKYKGKTWWKMCTILKHVMYTLRYVHPKQPSFLFCSDVRIQPMQSRTKVFLSQDCNVWALSLNIIVWPDSFYLRESASLSPWYFFFLTHAAREALTNLQGCMSRLGMK